MFLLYLLIAFVVGFIVALNISKHKYTKHSLCVVFKTSSAGRYRWRIVNKMRPLKLLALMPGRGFNTREEAVNRAEENFGDFHNIEIIK